MNVGGILGVI